MPQSEPGGSANALRIPLSFEGALVVAILIDLVVTLMGWYLRIRGIKGPLVIVGLFGPAIAVWLVLYLRFFRYPRQERRPLPRDPLLAIITVAFLLIEPLGGFEEKGDWARKLSFAFFVAIVVFGEELFYRGVLQNALERFMHPLIAILLANVGFVVCHAPVMEINALSVSIIAAAGVLSGAIFQLTRILWWPTVLHVLGDWVLIIPAPLLLGNEAVIASNTVIIIVTLAWWNMQRRRS